MFAGFWEPLSLSIKIAILAAMFAFVISLGAAKVLSSTKSKWVLLIELLLLVPLVLPPSVTGLLLITVFGRNSIAGRAVESLFGEGLIFTWWAGVIAAAVVVIPLMYQSLKLGFSSIEEDIKGAAKVDGAGGWALFWKIEFPLSYKYILTGFILSFARGLGEFGATLMFAGNIPGKTQTASTAIYTAIETGRMQQAWTWAGALIVISFLLLFIVQWMSKGKE
ncbi:molybdate ABC transporter permease subunit [Falsibacillus pallidus]|uniref:molybdate ABC transporter permease subunit n=1 Tax=Falsibacillus pallidus TaxID=493781 RepID=UPI003D97D137